MFYKKAGTLLADNNMTESNRWKQVMSISVSDLSNALLRYKVDT